MTRLGRPARDPSRLSLKKIFCGLLLLFFLNQDVRRTDVAAKHTEAHKLLFFAVGESLRTTSSN